MKNFFKRWSIIIILILISALFFELHFKLYHDSVFLLEYTIYNFAFLPLELLLVTLVFNKLLEDREKEKKLKTLNMVIGVFFSEVGTELLKKFIEFEKDSDDIRNMLKISQKWTTGDFKIALDKLRKHHYNSEIALNNLECLKDYLFSKRDFMLRIIENPSLVEHQIFSDLLTSLFHLQEELSNRKNICSIAGNDLAHIQFDLSRAHKLLLMQWVLYIKHIKNEYPYLFSFAVRTNPFDEDAIVEIK